MPGIYPHPSGSADDYRPGDQVKWYINENEISPYVGVVTEVCPAINKVWVEFPVGGNQQKDPTELILVTKFMGESPVSENSGYDSYGKALSRTDYGTLRQNLMKSAKNIVKEIKTPHKVSKMASKVAKDFAENTVDKLAADIVECINDELSDIQTYQRLYPKYEKICSDGFMRNAVDRIYKIVKAGKKEYVSIVFLQNSQDFDNFKGKKGPEAQSAFFEASDEEKLKYLQQWDYGDSGETCPKPSHGSSDRIYKKGDYIMSYNPGLGYAGLEREVEAD